MGVENGRGRIYDDTYKYEVRVYNNFKHVFDPCLAFGHWSVLKLLE